MYTINYLEHYISIWSVYFDEQQTTDTVGTVSVTLQLAETI